MYFDGINNVDDLKKRMQQLARENHPDMGGDLEVMKRISAEFTELFAKLKHIRRPAADTGTASGTSADTSAETGTGHGTTADRIEIRPEDFPTYEAYQAFIDLMFKVYESLDTSELKIELCGSWLWVSGNTYPVKETLKALGFKYASKKRMWYWYYGERARSYHKPISHESVKRMYGCKTVSAENSTKKVLSA